MSFQSSPIKLIHAILVCPLRGHRGGRDVRGCFRIVDIADEGLRMELKRLAHESCNSIKFVSTENTIKLRLGW